MDDFRGVTEHTYLWAKQSPEKQQRVWEEFKSGLGVGWEFN